MLSSSKRSVSCFWMPWYDDWGCGRQLKTLKARARTSRDSSLEPCHTWPASLSNCSPLDFFMCKENHLLLPVLVIHSVSFSKQYSWHYKFVEPQIFSEWLEQCSQRVAGDDAEMSCRFIRCMRYHIQESGSAFQTMAPFPLAYMRQWYTDKTLYNLVNGTQTRQYIILNHTMRNLVPFQFFFSLSQVKKTFPGWAGESLAPLSNLINLPF